MPDRKRAEPIDTQQLRALWEKSLPGGSAQLDELFNAEAAALIGEDIHLRFEEASAPELSPVRAQHLNECKHCQQLVQLLANYNWDALVDEIQLGLAADPLPEAIAEFPSRPAVPARWKQLGSGVLVAVSAGVYLGPPTHELPMTEETKQCRHIKSGMLVASTTIRHESIVGRTLVGGSTVEFLSTTELCGMCSGIIIATLQHLEADDEARHPTFGRVVDAVGEMNSADAPKGDTDVL